LRQIVTRICQTGLSYDTESCLLCIILALGSISTSNDPEVICGSPHSTNTPEHVIYYQAALARFGVAILEQEWIGVQAAFLVGSYNMWTMKFRKASIMYRVAAAKCKCLLDMKMDRGTASTSEISDSLEQLICWACLKTECELMEETNLDVSRRYTTNFSTNFPSPPSTAPELESTNDFLMSSVPVEKIWFYYLTELAFRRLVNRVVSDLLAIETRQENLPRFVEAISEFEYQAEQW